MKHRIIGQALLKLGAEIDMGSQEYKTALEAYPDALRALLDAHPWNFDGEYPLYFQQALTARLVAEICLPITESSSRSEVLHRVAAAELRLAKLVHSQQCRPEAPEHEDVRA